MASIITAAQFCVPVSRDNLLASPLHVMAGLVPAIHVFLCRRAGKQDVDAATPARSRASSTRYARA
jgi:hypothetical protein